MKAEIYHSICMFFVVIVTCTEIKALGMKQQDPFISQLMGNLNTEMSSTRNTLLNINRLERELERYFSAMDRYWDRQDLMLDNMLLSLDHPGQTSSQAQTRVSKQNIAKQNHNKMPVFKSNRMNHEHVHNPRSMHKVNFNVINEKIPPKVKETPPYKTSVLKQVSINRQNKNKANNNRRKQIKSFKAMSKQVPTKFKGRPPHVTVGDKAKKIRNNNQTKLINKYQAYRKHTRVVHDSNDILQKRKNFRMKNIGLRDKFWNKGEHLPRRKKNGPQGFTSLGTIGLRTNKNFGKQKINFKDVNKNIQSSKFNNNLRSDRRTSMPHIDQHKRQNMKNNNSQFIVSKHSSKSTKSKKTRIEIH